MRRYLVPLGLAAASLGAIALVLAHAGAAPGRGPDRPTRTEAEIRELDIAFYQARAARDPYGAGDRAQLGRLFLQRARETGDHGDLLRAEETARGSLAIRQGRNGAAYAILASSLMGQHRFPEALEAAERLLALDSASVGARAMLGEIQLELGRYAEARRTLGRLSTRRREPAVAPRLARWEELRGRPEAARALLREARDRARRAHGTPAEQLAWFQLRLGDLAMRHGHLEEAAEELEGGLNRWPGDYRLLGAAARLALLRGDARTARELGERAIGRTLDPATLALLHDAAWSLGDTAGATEYSRAMALAVKAQPGPLHRAWSMFLLDQGLEAASVLERARAELATRQDVYGWDLFAWALHRAGRHREAGAAMSRALALGTRDAAMQYHAGMIARAAGDRAGAIRYLKRALAINPHWHHRQPATARAVLDSLRRDGGAS
jgi:tetratricopeptide (TPR) repeat protein